MKPSVLLAGIVAACFTGTWTALALAGAFTNFLPQPLRGYVLQLCIPVFMAGGLLVGVSALGRWRVPAVFAFAAAVPGYWIPLLWVATQGISRPLDLVIAQFLLPAIAYAIMGTLGSLSAGLGWRRSFAVAAAFGTGILLGPLAVRIAGPRFSVATAIIIGTPWLTGSALLAWFEAHRANHSSE